MPFTAKSLDGNLKYNHKRSILAYFRPFLPNLGQMGFFFKNRAPLRKTSYRPKTSCKKSEKSLHGKYKKNVKNENLHHFIVTRPWPGVQKHLQIWRKDWKYIKSQKSAESGKINVVSTLNISRTFNRIISTITFFDQFFQLFPVEPSIFAFEQL